MSPKHHDACEAALQIIKSLRAEGHTALLAGGCVRDRLLSRTPKDYDVVTNATPDRVRTLFPRSRQVGAKFGVMLVRRYGHEIEVATFRADGPYSDGRHPDAITFGTEVEDARRRDFTINGLFFDPVDERVIDHIDGRADLEAGIIRTIGDPARRFAEDHLRMLRAVRFAARLGFQIHPDTHAAIRRLARRLASISAERVWMELAMLLTDPARARGWSLLVETGLREHLTPSWPRDDKDDEVARARLAALPPHHIHESLAMSAALCGRAPKEAAGVCRSLRLSNQAGGTVVWLIRSLRALHAEDSLELADLKLLMAEPAWADLLELLRADLAAVGCSPEVYERVRRRADAVAAENVAPPPLLTGDDLCNMGMSPGPRLGETLRAIRRAQLNEQISTRDDAAALARELLKGQPT